MSKALTREDLLYILQSLFRISGQEDNAFSMLEDGLYVEDHHVDLQAHADNQNVHVDAITKEVLAGFSLSEAGLLLYNGSPVTMAVSRKDGNSIAIELDGLYVPSVAQDAADHLADDDIHVTKQDKEAWSKSLQDAKDFTRESLDNLVLYNIEVVSALPEPTNVPVDSPELLEEGESLTYTLYPSSTTLYLLANALECPEECSYIPYVYRQDQWQKIGITNETLKRFALKEDVKEAIQNTHTHENAAILGEFTESSAGDLLYKGEYIRNMGVSDKEDNAVRMVNGKLYVRDFDREIRSMQTGAAGLEKYTLYSDEISDSGLYVLADNINNYSMILVEYYYKPDDDTRQPGCAKTAVIDTDTLNYLYDKNMDYMLEYGYGVLMSNSKIRMQDNKLWVNYYHNVCIYRITGIGGRGADSDE